MILHGTYDHQLWLDAGWIGFYVLWGAAALHPSMRTLDAARRERESVLTRFRLGLLTAASLIAPTLGLVHDLQRGRRRHGGRPRRVDRAVRARRSCAWPGSMRQQERIARARAGLQRGRRRARRRDDARGDRRRRGRRGARLVGPGNVALLCRVDDGDEVVVGSCAGTERLGLTDRLPTRSRSPLLKAAADGAVAVLAPGALSRARRPTPTPPIARSRSPS